MFLAIISKFKPFLEYCKLVDDNNMIQQWIGLSYIIWQAIERQGLMLNMTYICLVYSLVGVTPLGCYHFTCIYLFAFTLIHIPFVLWQEKEFSHLRHLSWFWLTMGWQVVFRYLFNTKRVLPLTNITTLGCYLSLLFILCVHTYSHSPSFSKRKGIHLSTVSWSWLEL